MTKDTPSKKKKKTLTKCKNYKPRSRKEKATEDNRPQNMELLQRSLTWRKTELKNIKQASAAAQGRKPLLAMLASHVGSVQGPTAHIPSSFPLERLAKQWRLTPAAPVPTPTSGLLASFIWGVNQPMEVLSRPISLTQAFQINKIDLQKHTKNKTIKTGVFPLLWVIS